MEGRSNSPTSTELAALLVLPPGGVIRHFAEHLGIAFLRCMLARAGLRAEQYLPASNGSLPSFAAFLRAAGPRLVGFTVYESNLLACRAMALVVREALPEAVVLVGGPNATFSPEETLELVGADVCVRGAGEGIVVPLVSSLLGAGHPRGRRTALLAGIPNLVLRDGAGACATPSSDLSSFPAGHFAHLDDIPSPYAAGLVASSDVGLLTARGCNQHCTYCSFAAISGHRVHFHGVERVLDDLAVLRTLFHAGRHRRAAIPVDDDTFTLSPARARALCEGILSRGLEVPLEAMTRADRVDRALLGLMRRAGFVRVSFGLESAVPRVLRAIGKVQAPEAPDDPGFLRERAYLEAVRSAVAAAREVGLAATVSVMGGLPGEAPQDFRATLDFVDALGVPAYGHNLLALMPGTPAYRDRRRHGMDAGRDEATLAWRTRHAFDPRSVRPLPSADLQAQAWAEAHLLAEALCGGPGPDGAGEGAAWAVVVHAARPSSRLARWIRSVLALNGAVVAVSPEGAAAPAGRSGWSRALNEAGVAFGVLALLAAERTADGRTELRARGGGRDLRFALEPAWAGGPAFAAEGTELLRVAVWLASAPGAVPPRAATGALRSGCAQIADGCRWWSGWPRCQAPSVLHVWPDGAVRPCWFGPVIGTVASTYPELAARGLALTAPGSGGGDAPARCPLGPPGGPDEEIAAAVEELELAAQVSWMLGRHEVSTAR